MLLKVENLQVSRDRELVLENVSFDIKEGSIMGLTGPNGGGKTSLFETLLGILHKYEGSIRWSRACSKAYVPQHSELKKLLPLTVEDFIKMGEWANSSPYCDSLASNEVMQRLQLEELSSKMVSELSGGEWRRVLLGRSLVQSADIYFLDEPFNHLDMQIEEKVGGLLKHLAEKHQKTFFVVSHDWHAMDHYFDQLILLNKKIITQGSVSDVSKIYHDWKSKSHHEWIHA